MNKILVNFTIHIGILRCAQIKICSIAMYTRTIWYKISQEIIKVLINKYISFDSFLRYSHDSLKGKEYAVFLIELNSVKFLL